MAPSPRSILVIAIALLGVVAGVVSSQIWLRASKSPVKPVSATRFTAPRPLPEFELVDHHGQVFDRQRLLDHWSLIFFGFTNCPDVCPTTMTTLSQVYSIVSAKDPSLKLDVIFISLDPMRDSVEKLAQYVPFFNPEFVGARGEMEQIVNLTRNLGVAFSYTELPDDDQPGQPRRYTVDHSATIFLIDPQGRWAGIFSAPHDAGQIAGDFLLISGDTR